MKEINGKLIDVHGAIAIVVGRFNSFITERLLEGALDALKRHGVDSSMLTVVRVPGAFEIPLAVRKLAETGRYAGVVALGCVIRGATPHFDYVAGECARGLNQVSLDRGIPVGFGVLTTDSVDQAIERSGSKAGNKGADAALTVVEMISLIDSLNE